MSLLEVLLWAGRPRESLKLEGGKELEDLEHMGRCGPGRGVRKVCLQRWRRGVLVPISSVLSQASVLPLADVGPSSLRGPSPCQHSPHPAQWG
jgi:hypothetical protein